MDFKLWGIVFSTVFLAEMADKTQLAAFLYASESPQRIWTVFFSASLALVVSTALAVFAGGLISHWVNPIWMTRISGAAFIVIGAWLLWKG